MKWTLHAAATVLSFLAWTACDERCGREKCCSEGRTEQTGFPEYFDPLYLKDGAAEPAPLPPLDREREKGNYRVGLGS